MIEYETVVRVVKELSFLAARCVYISYCESSPKFWNFGNSIYLLWALVILLLKSR